MHSDLVVLGGGPGGYAAAFLAADEGMEVTIVEAHPKLGGTCLLRGCIPSKALLHVAKVISEVDELGAEWGVDFGAPKIDIDQVRARKDKVISTLTGGLAALAKRRNVTVIKAKGCFENSTALRLEGDDPSIPEGGQITFKHCVLATGSVPAMPPNFQIGSDRVMDSTGALELKDIPESLLVVGGGYIGLEMGSVYANLGTKVSVVELQDGLLMGADRDLLVKPLEKRMRGLFEDRIFLSTKVGSMAEVDNQVEVTFEGPGKYGHERFDPRSRQRRPQAGQSRYRTGKHSSPVGPAWFCHLRRSATNPRPSYLCHRRRCGRTHAGTQSFARREDCGRSPSGRRKSI